MSKLTYRDIDVQGKRVLMRVDFNVPLAEDNGRMRITDDTRIQEALTTIKDLASRGAKVILMSHLGRPKGERKPEMSLKPAADHLATLIDAPVKFVGDCIGDEADQAVSALNAGEVLLLENTRFYAGEEKNEAEFAKKLAKHGEIYINDAFGTAHRAHASTAGVTEHISTCAMGALLEKELKYLEGELGNPAKPFVVIMGGAKVSDKIGVIEALLAKADTFLIGGAMAYTFSKALGQPVGASRVEEDKLDVALDLLEKAKARNTKFLIPIDNVEADKFDKDAQARNTPEMSASAGISEGWMGLDIGERTQKLYTEEIKSAKTIFWNGPMGVFEFDKFAGGTFAVAHAVAESDSVSIIGGGDSVTAVNKAGLADQMTFISTGGGASLELLEGQELPGVAALDDKN